MRMMRFGMILMVMLGFMPAYQSFAGNKSLILTHDGVTGYKIVVPKKCEAPDATAAKELRTYLKKISGVDFEITNIEQSDGKNIYVGTSPTVKKLLPSIDFNNLKPDEIIIKTVGNSCVFTGQGTRGALYAVYTFLEDILGVRWWTATEEYVPDIKRVTLSPLDIRYAPALEFREVFYHGISRGIQGPESIFAVRSKINGNYVHIPSQYGGHYNYAGPYCPCSGTFDKLIPAKKYFDQHPEWFSLVEGKRVGGLHKGQLCLTNEEMKKELIKNAEHWLEQYPDAEWLAISMNDNRNYCQCSECQKIAKSEGAQSGVLIRFLNDVAEVLKKKKPDIKIISSAYLCYLRPPEVTRPNKHVIMRIAPIDANYFYPMTSPENAVIQKDFEGWKKMTDSIFVWDYVANYKNYLLPHPNLPVLAPNIRYYIKQGAIGIYEEGILWSSISDFSQLRVWLISHLLWKPQSDENALRKEFMSGYYGAAAPFLNAYLNCYYDAAKEAKLHLNCGGFPSFIPPLETLDKCWELFDEAENAVKDNLMLRQRVQRERAPLIGLLLQNSNVLRWLIAKSGKKVNFPDGRTLLNSLEELNKIYRPRRFASDKSFADFQSRCEQKLETPVKPEGFEKLDESQWLDFQEPYMKLWGEGKTSSIVADDNASNKKAASIVGNTNGWDINCPMPGHIECGNPWRCYAVVRCDADADDGLAAKIGLFDRRVRRDTPERIPFIRNLSVKEIKGE
ncbi:MAG: DUF4838 domain-containing protein, partial [Victivallales bacterium]|nr:DUF4838 domain-containing protein [Victivallales bacterium]